MGAFDGLVMNERGDPRVGTRLVFGRSVGSGTRLSIGVPSMPLTLDHSAPRIDVVQCVRKESHATPTNSILRDVCCAAGRSRRQTS